MPNLQKVNQLRDLKCEEVSVVDRGANPGAVVAFLKRDTTAYVVKKAFVMPDEDLTEYRPGDRFDTNTAESEEQIGLLVKSGSIRLAESIGKKEKQMAESKTTKITKGQAAANLKTYVIAKMNGSETEAQALLRLLRTDSAAQGLYESHSIAKDDQVRGDDDVEDKETPEEKKLRRKGKKMAKVHGCSVEQGILKAMERDPSLYTAAVNSRALTSPAHI